MITETPSFFEFVATGDGAARFRPGPGISLESLSRYDELPLERPIDDFPLSPAEWAIIAGNLEIFLLTLGIDAIEAVEDGGGYILQVPEAPGRAIQDCLAAWLGDVDPNEDKPHPMFERLVANLFDSCRDQLGLPWDM